METVLLNKSLIYIGSAGADVSIYYCLSSIVDTI